MCRSCTELLTRWPIPSIALHSSDCVERIVCFFTFHSSSCFQFCLSNSILCLFVYLLLSLLQFEIQKAPFTHCKIPPKRNTSKPSQHRRICNKPISIYGQCGPCGFRLYPFYCKIMRWKFVTIFTATFGWVDALLTAQLLLRTQSISDGEEERRAEDNGTHSHNRLIKSYFFQKVIIHIEIPFIFIQFRVDAHFEIKLFAKNERKKISVDANSSNQ